MKYSKSQRLAILNTVTAILYIIVFRLVYVNYLAVFHEYTGVYRVENNTFLAVVATDIIAFLPILFYKVENRISNYISIFLYVMVYVPTLIGIQYYYKDYLFVVPYQLAYLFAMLLFFKAGSNSISKREYGNIKKAINKKVFVLFGVIDLLIIVAVFHSRMRLVSFFDVYDLRSDSSDFDPGIPFLGYLMMWMNSIISLLIALGLKEKNKKYVLIGFTMALAYYMVNGMKGVLFAAALAFLMYCFVKKWGFKYVFPLITSGLHAAYLLVSLADNEAISMGISILLNRTYGIASQITPMYIDVFQSHPYTYFSHIGIINRLTGMYPFGDMALGYAITDIYNGDNGQANTNFLVTDGLSSCGVLGVVIISIFFYFLISYINSISNRFDKSFVAASIMGSILALTNLSIFTTLLSSGLLFLMIFFRTVKLNNLQYEKN